MPSSKLFNNGLFQKEGIVHPIVRYRILSANSHVSYDTANKNLFHGVKAVNFAQVNTKNNEYGAEPYWTFEKDISIDSLYKSRLHIFDCTIFSHFCHLWQFTLFLEESLCGGYTWHSFNSDIKSIDRPVGEKPRVCLKKGLDCYDVDDYDLTCIDKKLFSGIAFIAGCMLNIAPLEMASSFKICPYISYISSDCHAVEDNATNNEIFHDIENYSFSHGLIFELNNGIFWNMLLENYSIRMGLSHNLLFVSIGDKVDANLL